MVQRNAKLSCTILKMIESLTISNEITRLSALNLDANEMNEGSREQILNLLGVLFFIPLHNVARLTDLRRYVVSQDPRHHTQCPPPITPTSSLASNFFVIWVWLPFG